MYLAFICELIYNREFKITAGIKVGKRAVSKCVCYVRNFGAVFSLMPQHFHVESFVTVFTYHQT